jgi:predicted Rdx family selenoprotein
MWVEEWRLVMGMLAFDLISAVMTALVKKALEQGLESVLMILGLYLVLWGKKRDEASPVSCATNRQVDEEADNKQ